MVFLLALALFELEAVFLLADLQALLFLLADFLQSTDDFKLDFVPLEDLLEVSFLSVTSFAFDGLATSDLEDFESLSSVEETVDDLDF